MAAAEAAAPDKGENWKNCLQKDVCERQKEWGWWGAAGGENEGRGWWVDRCHYWEADINRLTGLSTACAAYPLCDVLGVLCLPEEWQNDPGLRLDGQGRRPHTGHSRRTIAGTKLRGH